MLSGKPFQPWASGLATAFATSFAYLRIIGTPKNIIVYGLARYPGTGERILREDTPSLHSQKTFANDFSKEFHNPVCFHFLPYQRFT